jgi:hypothetical protein
VIQLVRARVEDLAIVAVGGQPVGATRPRPQTVMRLRCARCGELYPMATDPLALALSPLGATVLPGFVETCPICYGQTVPGGVLEVC